MDTAGVSPARDLQTRGLTTLRTVATCRPEVANPHFSKVRSLGFVARFQRCG